MWSLQALCKYIGFIKAVHYWIDIFPFSPILVQNIGNTNIWVNNLHFKHVLFRSQHFLQSNNFRTSSLCLSIKPYNAMSWPGTKQRNKWYKRTHLHAHIQSSSKAFILNSNIVLHILKLWTIQLKAKYHIWLEQSDSGPNQSINKIKLFSVDNIYKFRRINSIYRNWNKLNLVTYMVKQIGCKQMVLINSKCSQI